MNFEHEPERHIMNQARNHPTREEVIDLANRVVNAPLLPIMKDEFPGMRVVIPGTPGRDISSHIALERLGPFRPDVGYEMAASYVRYHSFDLLVNPAVGIGILNMDNDRPQLIALDVAALTANMAQEMITHLYSVLESALAPATV